MEWCILFVVVFFICSYSSTLSSVSALDFNERAWDDDDDEEGELDTWSRGTPLAEEKDPSGAEAPVVESCLAPTLAPSGFRNLLFRRVLWGFFSEKAHSSAMRFMR